MLVFSCSDTFVSIYGHPSHHGRWCFGGSFTGFSYLIRRDSECETGRVLLANWAKLMQFTKPPCKQTLGLRKLWERVRRALAVLL